MAELVRVCESESLFVSGGGNINIIRQLEENSGTNFTTRGPLVYYDVN
jgi:hypothetical protein